MTKRSHARNFKRRGRPEKELKPTVLIVCEDRVSSPGYFKFLSKLYRIKTKVRICGEECGSTPLNIIDYAKRLNEKRMREKKSKAYECIWCVFDTEGIRNPHPFFREAINKAESNGFLLALSNPCFEYWYLLHFENTAKPGHHCDEIIRFLKKHYASYAKGDEDIFETIFENTDTAVTRARNYMENRFGDENPLDRNPSTEVYKLVEFLRSISH
jgi:hypothetical protein